MTRPSETAVWKSRVEGRRTVCRLNVDGDAQGDLVGHGGEHRAVFVYQMDSYHYWERFLRRNDFTLGQFGENFTVEGLLDQDVCIGDRYRIGSADSASCREMSADPDARARLLLRESDLDVCHGGLRVERDELQMLLVRA
jgi:hypothetical protein